MNSRDIYKEGYDFARKKSERKAKALKVATLLIPVFIILFILMSFVLSLNIFKEESTVTTQPYVENTSSKIIQERLEQEVNSDQEAYKNSKIHYRDAQNRLAIIFMSPYVGGDIGVVIYTNKDYDEIKKEAEDIINKAKSTVSITSVVYINKF